MNDTTKDNRGRAVVLPNGKRRIDFIRDSYYTNGKHTDKCMERSDIKKAINDMLEKAGKVDEQITYQIVFAATKTPEGVDPRIAAAAAAKVREANKAEKAATKEREKVAAAKAKTDKAAEDAKE